MRSEVKAFEQKEITESKLSHNSGLMNENAAGFGDADHYFHAEHLSLNAKEIKESLSNTDALFKKNNLSTINQSSAALFCMVNKQNITIAQVGNEHRAILVYKQDGQYKIKVISGEALSNTDFKNPQIINHDIKNIELTSAFIITATKNFYGSDYIPTPNCRHKASMEEQILYYFNQDKKNKDTLAETIIKLKDQAVARNIYMNSFRTSKGGLITNNEHMIVCINRLNDGCASGIVSESCAHLLHKGLMFKQAIKDMTSVVNSKSKTNSEKIAAILYFRSVYITLPFWKKYSEQLTFITVIAIGAILGGLFGGPLFLPCLFLRTAHAAAVEGAFIAFSSAVTCAGLHYAYSSYRLNYRDAVKEKDDAILDVKNHLSI